jgi:ABC-type nitrate/sulfonate/bicarbonate transport system permease component
VSRKLAAPGDVKDFGNRARGALCPNNLYLAALAIPVVAIIPALIIDFSFGLLAIFVAVVALLVFRFFVMFTKVACVHCRAKSVCPNAKSMGLA